MGDSARGSGSKSRGGAEVGAEGDCVVAGGPVQSIEYEIALYAVEDGFGVVSYAAFLYGGGRTELADHPADDHRQPGSVHPAPADHFQQGYGQRFLPAGDGGIYDQQGYGGALAK